MTAKFASLGLEVERKTRSDVGDILIARSGTGRQLPLLCSLHIDTVHPPESEFNSINWEGENIFGPGTVDMKGSFLMLVAVLQVFNQHDRLHKIPLLIVVVSDEEKGSLHCRDLLLSLANECSNALVFECARENDQLIVQRKGLAKFIVQVFGASAHAGNAAGSGANAIEQSAHMVLALQGLNKLEREISCNVGKITGGVASNVVPDYVELEVEVRAVSNADLEEVIADVERISRKNLVDGTSVKLRELVRVAPFQQSERSLKLHERYQEAGRLVGVAFSRQVQTIGGVSNANDMAGAGIGIIDGVGPRGGGAHTSQEFVNFPSIVDKAKAFLAFLCEEYLK